MGAAKNRKAEIAQLKTVQPKLEGVDIAALNLCDAAKKVCAVYSWSKGYEAPNGVSDGFLAIIGKTLDSAKQHKISSERLKKMFKDVLVVREQLEERMYAKYPKINKKKFKSMDSDLEIAKVSSADDQFFLGFMDLLCGSLFSAGLI